MRAALTGHLVFSTLHTNDAPTAITRLIDLGIEPYFVSSSLVVVVAQRLIRMLCQECREPYVPNPAHVPPSLSLKEGQVLYRKRGCASCANTGYFGRKAIYEMMPMDERLERLSSEKASPVEIRKAARQAGMRTLLESGLRKVLMGETTIDEVLRVTVTNGPDAADTSE